MMSAGPPPSLWLLPLLLLAALSSCSHDSASTIPADEFMVDVESPVHDVRCMYSSVPWAVSDETFSVMYLGDDRTGWHFSWRVGSGEILSGATAGTMVWRTSADTLSWVESTLSRGRETHVCRRWTALRLEPLSVGLQPESVAPGWTVINSEITASPRAPLTRIWGVDVGEIQVEEDGQRVVWDVRTTGVHRVWLQVDDGLRQAADTLEVTVPNVAPEFGPGSAELGADWPCGALLDVFFKGVDANRDSLTLDVLSLDGLVLEGMSQHAAHPSMFVEYQTYWVLALRDVGEGAGWRSIFLQLSDGSATHEQVFHFWALCP